MSRSAALDSCLVAQRPHMLRASYACGESATSNLRVARLLQHLTHSFGAYCPIAPRVGQVPNVLEEQQ
jgi:hypothetical protein